MEFNYALKSIGEFGTYQRLLCALLCLVSVPSAFQAMGYVFWGATPIYWCHESGIQSVDVYNTSYDGIQNLSANLHNGDVDKTRNQCFRYGNISEMDNATKGPDTKVFSDSSEEKCQRWEYDNSVYKSTIVTQFDLVCDRRWLASTTQSLYMIGRVMGCIVSGYVSDRYGRRVTISVFAVLEFVLSLSLCFTTSYASFAVIRTLEAMAGTGVWQTAFVILLEVVGPSWRVAAGNGINIAWAFSYMTLAGIAYCLRDRFSLQLATSLPTAFLLLFPWLVPESPRWLIVTGHMNRARKILRKIARVNKTQLPEDCEIVVKSDGQTKGNFFHIFRYPNLRIKTLILIYAWFANSFVYYGLSLNTSNLGGNDFINFFIAGAVEVPAYLLVWALLNRIGRRLSQSGALLISGIALLFCAVIPKERYALIVTLAMIGKFAVSASFSIVYVYSAEVFPTCIRATSIGACSMVARAAGALACYTIHLAEVMEVLPLIVCGGVATASGVSILVLPETKNKPLPETIADGEALARNHIFINWFAGTDEKKKSRSACEEPEVHDALNKSCQT